MISSAGIPLPGISASSQPHTRRDVRAVLGVRDVAVAGELVALVAVLASALAVALAGDRRHAAAGLAELAGGEAEVDRGKDVVDAFGLLLDAAGVQQHPGRRGAPPLGGLLDARRRHAGDVRRPCGVISPTAAAACVEVDRVRVDELVIEPVVRDELVEHGAEQRRVRAGSHREEQVGGAGKRDDAGVLDDQLGATVAGAPDVARRDRERLGDVRPRDPHHVGERDVAPRVRGAIDAERLLVAGARRHHAEAAVVVEVRGVQGEAGELADEVALLVRERDAREHGERVVAVRRLDPPDLARRHGRGRRPTRSAGTRRARRGRAPSAAAAGRDGCLGGSASRPSGRACLR